MNRLLIWIVWNVPCGRLAPWLFGLAIKRKPKRIKNKGRSIE